MASCNFPCCLKHKKMQLFDKGEWRKILTAIEKSLDRCRTVTIEVKAKNLSSSWSNCSITRGERILEYFSLAINVFYVFINLICYVTYFFFVWYLFQLAYFILFLHLRSDLFSFLKLWVFKWSFWIFLSFTLLFFRYLSFY